MKSIIKHFNSAVLLKSSITFNVVQITESVFARIRESELNLVE